MIATLSHCSKALVLVVVALMPLDILAYSVAAKPNLQMKTSGSVYDVLVEPDGHIIVAGSFDEAGGLPRKNLARLNADGSVDPNWVFDTSGSVYSVARTSTGQIYVAGNFSEIGGSVRNGVARISNGPGGPMLDAWVPEGVYRPSVIEVAAGDDVFMLVDFVIRRFPAGGTAPDLNWGGEAQNTFAWDLEVSPDGEYVATCESVGDIPLFTRMGALVWRKTWDGWCSELAFAPDGSVFAGRVLFADLGVIDRQVVSRITLAGDYDPAWEREIGPIVDSFGFMPSGIVWVGTVDGRRVGADTSANGTGFAGGQLGTLFRFEANGVPISGDPPEADSNYESLTVLPGGDVLAAGQFKVVAHERRDALVRLAPDTMALRPAFGSLMIQSYWITALLKLVDGSYLISGSFTSIDGQPRRMLARLSEDFDLLPDTWPLDRAPIRMVQNPAGDCYLAGAYPLTAATSPSSLLKLGGCTTVDPNWRPLVSHAVGAMTVGIANDSAVYVASCADPNAQRSNDCQVQRFPTSATGAVAPTWTLQAFGSVNALMVDNAALFVGGQFRSLGAAPREGLAKVGNAVLGTVDPLWVAERSPRYVAALAANGDGEIIASGRADSFGSRPALIRLSSTSGAENTAWKPWQSINPPLALGAMAFLPDGNLYVADSRYTCCVWRTVASGATEGLEAGWAISVYGRVDAMLGAGPSGLLLAGSFLEVNGQSRTGLARLLDVNPILFVDQFE